jgi:hypothetical protein
VFYGVQENRKTSTRDLWMLKIAYQKADFNHRSDGYDLDKPQDWSSLIPSIPHPLRIRGKTSALVDLLQHTTLQIL